MTNKIFKFCNKVTKDPMFAAVVVFTMSFLVSGVLLEASSALDNGEHCSRYKIQDDRTFCTKANAVAIVLAVSLPVMFGIIAYILGKKKRLVFRKERLWYK